MRKRIVAKCNIIKETNSKKILELICKGEELTKLEIAHTLKISIPTVTTNINELKEQGIVDEVSSDIYTGGRRPKVIKLRANAKVSIGIGITKSKVIVMVMNLLNEVIWKEEQDFSDKHFLSYIHVGKKIADQILEHLKIEKENILGVGISIPGAINETRGVAEYTNMGYKEIKLDEIFDLFENSVYIENEANLSLIAEKIMGGYEDLKNLLYIGINEGLGGGIFVNGELFTGRNGRAGEFGHMYISSRPNSTPCRVESYISTLGLLNRYNQKSNQSIEKFSEFETLIYSNDELACEILNEGIDVLIATIYNLNMIFDIQKIIVGGKVARLIKSKNMPILDVMDKYNDLLCQLDTDIIFSDITRTTTVGAALLPIIDFYTLSSD